MPRPANSSRIAADVSGEGGIGEPKGITRVMPAASRRPWARRYASSSSAASLGAGGHLKDGPVTPTIASPPSKPASTSRRRSAPATE